ncbi:MAG: manganese-dependent inorganic pyrophosphatase [Candidatus Moranbacteria bacterium]|nr:manganese-dependent inorganic pyrophosphatase [Candidatus Moranbacteria bacterium]
MEKVTILGHTNQDTDATCAAICLEELLNKAKLFKAQAKISEKPNNETKFILKKFKIDKPALFKKPTKKEKVFLVDFNEESQSPVEFKKVEIEGLVDHHKLDICFKKDYPVIFRVEPIGSSCSIVTKMFKDYGLKISKKTASLLLCGILSDTLKFSSPTTTNEDKKLAKELADLAKINPNQLAKEMFEAKSDLTGILPKDIITTDYKEFKFGSKKTGIGVFETVDVKPIFEMEQKIRKALSQKKSKDNLDLMFFGAVDILKNQTSLILIGKNEEETAKKTFQNFKVENAVMQMPGVVSRKKQLVPEFIKKIK